MNHSKTSFFFPNTNTIESGRETVFFDYSGTKESFDEVISKVKKNVEFKSKDVLEEIVENLEYLSKNYDNYLISEVKSVVINKFGFIFLIITNTSYPENYNEKSRSLLAYLPHVKNQKQVNNSYNSYQNLILYGLSAAFFILLFRK